MAIHFCDPADWALFAFVLSLERAEESSLGFICSFQGKPRLESFILSKERVEANGSWRWSSMLEFIAA